MSIGQKSVNVRMLLAVVLLLWFQKVSMDPTGWCWFCFKNRTLENCQKLLSEKQETNSFLCCSYWSILVWRSFLVGSNMEMEENPFQLVRCFSFLLCHWSGCRLGQGCCIGQS